MQCTVCEKTSNNADSDTNRNYIKNEEFLDCWRWVLIATDIYRELKIIKNWNFAMRFALHEYSYI